MNRFIRNTAYMALAVLPLTAHATNGYFMHGSSVKAQGMAGVSYALAHDSIKAASNPASLIALGNQFDLGLTLFKPQREAEITGTAGGFLDGLYDEHADKQFWIPEIGFARQYNDRISYGVAMYGNGGMNTSYKNNPYLPLGSSGQAGVDLSQLFVTTSVAYKLNDKHSFGAGVTYVYQRFAAQGLQAFGLAGWSSDASALTNNGYDSSDGLGLKLGWQGKIRDDLTLAVTWSSKIETGKFDKYSGLFAGQGGFDVPQTYGAGFAWQINPRWTLAGDWEFIEYSDVASIGNSITSPGLLGAYNGKGFGWQDMHIYKLGVIYQASEQLTLRAGVSHAEQPVKASETLFNILAPGVIEDHISIGASWSPTPKQVVTLSYTHALEETVKGQNSLLALGSDGEANLSMSQDILGIAWQYRY